jgi:uncharacterized membrane protein
VSRVGPKSGAFGRDDAIVPGYRAGENPPARFEAVVGHNVRLARLRESLRNGLWFIPALSAAASIVTAVVVIVIDAALGPTEQTPFAFSGGPGSAQLVLSVIAGAVLSFTAVVFSITIVVLQLGSSQFSPRVLRMFLRDRGSKIAIGGFIATFVYAIIVLMAIRDEGPDREAFVPGDAVTLAFVQVFATIVAFVYYANHIAHSIRAVNIIESVARETRRAIDANYPLDRPDPGAGLESPAGPPTQVIHTEKAGALTGIDEDDLIVVASHHDCVLKLVPSIGDYLPYRAPVFEVYGGDGTLRPAEVLGAVGLGVERTMYQDVAFGFRQLVDIAEKALSPAINDPTTAVQAIDRLHDLLRRLVERPIPSGFLLTRSGRLRLMVNLPGWQDFVALAFSEIRHYGGGAIQVDRRLRAALQDLLDVAPADRQAALERELKLLDSAVERSFPDVEDQASAHHADRQGLGSEDR